MTDQDRTVWSSMLVHLRQHHPAICRQWFDDLEPVGVAGGTMQLRAKNSLYRDYLRRECNDPFGDAARSVTGRLLSVRFLGPEDEVLTPPPPPKRATPIGDNGLRGTIITKPIEVPAPRVQPASQATVHTPQRPAQHAGVNPAQRESKPAHIDQAKSPSHEVNGAINGSAAVAHDAVGVDDIQSGSETQIPSHGVVNSQHHEEFASPGEVNITFKNGDQSASPRVTIPEPRIPLEPTRRAESVLESKDPPREYRDLRENREVRDSRRGPSHYESLVVNPDFSFENFVHCPGNRMALAAAQAIASTPGRVYNPFFIHAAVGLGKTHLLQAICLRIAETNPRAVMYYTSCEGFVTQYFESVKEGEMTEFRHRFRDVDVLIIDDIHFLSKRESSQEEFFHTFNALYHMQKQIILSCDAAPEDIPSIEERLISRFKWGLVAKIEPPIFETRVAILKSKAAIRGLTMPDDVAMFIASKLSRNIRELEGAVVKLHIQVAIEKAPITLDMAKEALGESLSQPKGEPTLQAIIAAVTEFYGVRLTDLQSKGRQRSIALPRQVCMYLARRCTRHSLEEIGGFFGGRDHTTVMHAVETIDQRRTSDSELDLLLRSLEDKVRNSRAA